MLLPAPPLFPRKRKPRAKARRSAPPAPPLALTLVEAIYDPASTIRLTFDRAIEAVGLVGTQIVIDDGQFTNETYQATGEVGVIDAQTIEIVVVGVGGFAGADARLTAGAATGIVAVDDGGTWPGV